MAGTSEVKTRIGKLGLDLVERPVRMSIFLSLPIAVVLTVFISGISIWNSAMVKRDMISIMTDTGRAYFEQIMITRIWNARHGGVYVEVKGDIKPNPYLVDPEREIVTVQGRTYTKINPAFMTRQISGISQERGLYKFHITSLNPLNPGNRPDTWETEMLKSFEAGVGEGYLFEEGAKVFRYMAPLIVTGECLRCHAKQGYKLNDVRGGISVTFPSDRHEKAYFDHARTDTVLFFIMGAICLVIVVLMFWFFSVRFGKSILREVEAKKLDSAMMMANAAAHELRQPMTVVSGLSELVEDRVKNGEDVSEYVAVIVDQCARMNDIIEKMVSVTSYKTKTYDEYTEIFDIDPNK